MKNQYNFSNELVEIVSCYLQEYMKKNKITSLSADDCATILAFENILPNDIGPKSGFNFRQLLRDGRDGKINLVKGVFQKKPNTRWLIKVI